jgi:hypothetical protein
MTYLAILSIFVSLFIYWFFFIILRLLLKFQNYSQKNNCATNQKRAMKKPSNLFLSFFFPVLVSDWFSLFFK